MEGHGTKSLILVRDTARPLGLVINSQDTSSEHALHCGRIISAQIVRDRRSDRARHAPQKLRSDGGPTRSGVNSPAAAADAINEVL